MEWSRGPGVLAGALALMVVLSACGDEPVESASRAPVSDSESPSGATSSSETADPEPSVESASGPRLVLDNMAARGPEGWRRQQESLGMISAHHPENFGSVLLGDFGPAPASTHREFLRIIGRDDFRRPPEVSFDADLGGVPAFRAVGEGGLGPTVLYGAVKDGLGATLMVWFIEGRVSARERREVEESVVASFEWR